MNEEELKHHLALQPLYVKAMGPWQVGDRFLPYVPPKTKEVYPLLCCDIGNRNNGPVDQFGEEWLDALRIPLTIDDRNPERGLRGMVKHCIGMEFDGDTAVLIQTAGEQYKRIYADTPTLAIQKALVAQEGIEL